MLHCLSYLSSKGRAAIVCFPGIFYRSGTEQKIRKYLVDNNYVETVISLAPNLFYGTTISVNILVLSKHKTENKTQFIDASSEEFFKKETNNNVLTDKHIEKIMDFFDNKEDVEHITKSIDNHVIAEKDYNLSVSAYVEPKDNRDQIDITILNRETTKTEEKINSLRINIKTIISEIEDIGSFNKLLEDVDIEWSSLGTQHLLKLQIQVEHLLRHLKGYLETYLITVQIIFKIMSKATLMTVNMF